MWLLKWIKTSPQLLFLLSFLFSSKASAAPQQADSSGKMNVQIIFSRTGGMFTNASGIVMSRLVGEVQLKQEETIMYCDSAHLNQATNNLEAWGSVRIVQPGTTVESDYLRYTGNTRKAFLSGNVILVNGADNLWADQLEYDLSTKVGRYDNGGTLNREATTLTSNSGTYNLRTKDSRFTGDVYVVDPKYEVYSNDLGYNTESKVVRFYALSTVTNPNSVLVTKQGTYDTKNGIAHFYSRSSIKNKEQYIEADLIDYNEKNGIGKAYGNVLALDTMQKTTLYADTAYLNEGVGSMLAFGKPVLKKVNEKDSVYIRADTFYSAPIPKSDDTVKGKFVKRVGTIELPSAPYQDEVVEDTARPRYFIGYYKVKVFSDSLQAVCDSISYMQTDSTLRLMKQPVAWSRAAQITGNVIELLADSSAVRQLKVPGKAMLISRSGPPKAQLYDQVQGDTLWGFFTNNELDYMHVKPNAKSIYYATDDQDRYIGVNESESLEMKVFFNGSKIKRILSLRDHTQTLTPINKANLGAMKLERFEWHESKRPHSIEELFE